MFGYVQPAKGQLRVCEYELYKAVYCGLCKQLGRRYGPFSRLSLSYDFTFLALLQMGLDQQDPQFQPGRCLLNPLKRVPICREQAALDFSCGTAMIMLYFKALDNYRDGRLPQKLLALLCKPFCYSAYRKAAGQYPQVAAVLYEMVSGQAQLEADRCSSVDRACEPTALAMAQICRMLSPQPGQQRVLERMGYLLGRYIYPVRRAGRPGGGPAKRQLQPLPAAGGCPGTLPRPAPGHPGGRQGVPLPDHWRVDQNLRAVRARPF